MAKPCRLRLRPIVMTSLAFFFGVVPLILGAGAEMRRTLGIAVFAGMLGLTLFGIFVIPSFSMSFRPSQISASACGTIRNRRLDHPSMQQRVLRPKRRRVARKCRRSRTANSNSGESSTRRGCK